MSKTLIRLDASALVKSSCLLRLKRITVDGIRGKLLPNDIVYGSAFHKFVSEMALSKGNLQQAFNAMLEIWNRPKYDRNKFLTEQHLQNTCIDYWTYFQTKDNADLLSVDDRPLVEVDFCNKFYEDDKWIIELVGTIDKFVHIKNGMNCFGDYKTHSLYSITKNNKSFADKEINEYFKQYNLSCQLNFYCFNIKLMMNDKPEHAISKLFANQPIGYFIDGVFMSKFEKTIFKRSDVRQFTDKDYHHFYTILSGKISDFIRYLNTIQEVGEEPMDGLISGSCNEHKYPCMFHTVCSCGDDDIRKYLLTNEFDQVTYNPLEFSK